MPNIDKGITRVAEKDKRIKCIYCDKPIHIDNFAGVCKKGFICKDVLCLMKLAEDVEEAGG